MQGYNLLLIYNCSGEKILMCKRRKEPFKGLLNLAGGKIEIGEGGLEAAYRELQEETGITGEDIRLFHLMDVTYYCSQGHIEVYVGKLKRDVTVNGDENELFWIDANSRFYDKTVFAGGGNIGHFIEEATTWAAQIFSE